MTAALYPHPAADAPPRDWAAWNRELNRTHAMAGLRERGGWVVRAVEGRRRRLVAQAVLALAPRTVVDVGCEDGWMARAYAHGVERLVLCDVDPDVLARAEVTGAGRVERVVADALEPHPLRAQLPPRGADVVVASALLEHLPEPARALAALAPLVAPGGHFVVFVPADGPILAAKRVLRWTRLGALVRGLSLDPAPGHVQRFTRGSLARLLARFGTLVRLTFDPAVLGYLAVLRVGADRRGAGD
jgi:SAM-dependent methyltransferase